MSEHIPEIDKLLGHLDAIAIHCTKIKHGKVDFVIDVVVDGKIDRTKVPRMQENQIYKLTVAAKEDSDAS